MVITIVKFRAYDRQCAEAFIDKEIWEIHKALNIICNGYIPQSIKCITDEKEGYKDYPIDVEQLIYLQNGLDKNRI